MPLKPFSGTGGGFGVGLPQKACQTPTLRRGFPINPLRDSKPNQTPSLLLPPDALQWAY